MLDFGVNSAQQPANQASGCALCAPPPPAPACWGQWCALRQRGTPNDKGYKVIKNSFPLRRHRTSLRPRGWTEPPLKSELTLLATFSPPHDSEFTLEGWVALRSSIWASCEHPRVLKKKKKKKSYRWFISRSSLMCAGWTTSVDRTDSDRAEGRK